MPTGKKKLIVIIPMPGVYMLDIAGPADVFTAADKMMNEDPGDRVGGYEVLLASPLDAKKIVTKVGIEISCTTTAKNIDQPVDTLLVVGFSKQFFPAGHPFFHWLKDIYPKVGRIGSVCVGTYALAEAVILDGKQATTHCEFSQEFQQRYPAVKVDTNPFYTCDGNVYTSGGVASGIDLALAMVEEDYGREVALYTARKLLLPLKRPGYQSQFC